MPGGQRPTIPRALRDIAWHKRIGVAGGAAYLSERSAMLPKPESAYFALADISGYTSFLAKVELDHAQDIIADFMNTVVKALRPPFRLAKFEGDAAFAYAVAEKVDG